MTGDTSGRVLAALRSAAARRFIRLRTAARTCCPSRTSPGATACSRCSIRVSPIASGEWRRSSAAMRGRRIRARVLLPHEAPAAALERTAAPRDRRVPGRRLAAPGIPARLVRRAGTRQGPAGNRRGGRGTAIRARRSDARRRATRRQERMARGGDGRCAARGNSLDRRLVCAKRSSCASTGALASPTTRNSEALRRRGHPDDRPARDHESRR